MTSPSPLQTVVCVRCKRTMHPVGMVDDRDHAGRKRCGAYNARTCGQLEQARIDNAAETRLLREQARDACTRADEPQEFARQLERKRTDGNQ